MAMCMSKDFSNVQAVELSFSISDASKKVVAKIGSHEEVWWRKVDRSTLLFLVLVWHLV